MRSTSVFLLVLNPLLTYNSNKEGEEVPTACPLCVSSIRVKNQRWPARETQPHGVSQSPWLLWTDLFYCGWARGLFPVGAGRNSVTVCILVRAFWCPHVPFLSVSAGSRVLGPRTLSRQLDIATLKPYLLAGGPPSGGGTFHCRSRRGSAAVSFLGFPLVGSTYLGGECISGTVLDIRF